MKIKPIRGYEGLYEVSEWGEVYSLITHRFLKPSANYNCYLIVKLCKSGVVSSKRVHRLVAESFIMGYSEQ